MPEQTDSRAASPLGDRNFTLLWLAQIVSGFGDKITLVALAYVTWQLTGSSLATALAVVVATLPAATFGFFAGAIADAVGRRRAMVASDVLRVVFVGLIPVAITAGAPLGVIYVLALAAALCATVFMPARFALVPDLVAGPRLAGANALLYSSDRTVEVVGVLLAGMLVAVMGANAFFVDAATFAVSALLLSAIALREPPSQRVSLASAWRDAATGLRELRRNSVLWANTVYSLFAQLATPVLNGLAPVLVFRNFGGGATEFGITEAAIAAGAVAGGMFVPRLMRALPKGVLLVIGFTAYGALLAVLALAPTFWLAVAIFALLGVANVVYYVPNVTISQEVTPAPLRGRVFGTRAALLNLTWLPLIIVSGALADAVGVSVLYLAGGIFTVVVALIGALIPAVRGVR